MFSGYLFIRYARGPRVCVVCDGRNTTAQVNLEDKKKSRQNGFSKLESERKAVQPERDSRSHTSFKVKNRKTDFRNSNQNRESVKTKRDCRYGTTPR